MGDETIYPKCKSKEYREYKGLRKKLRETTTKIK